MQIAIEVTDEHRRAMRYLGHTQEDVEKEIRRQSADLLDNFVKRTKQQWLRGKTMIDVDPAPLS